VPTVTDVNPPSETPSPSEVLKDRNHEGQRAAHRADPTGRDPMAVWRDWIRDQIADCLRRLTEEGGSRNFVIFEVGEHHYVQFRSSCGSAVMYGEASSGQYCRPNCPYAPTAAERTRLLGLGWRPPTRRKFLNFYRFWPFISERDRQAIAETAVGTLELFGWDGEPLKVKLHLDW